MKNSRYIKGADGKYRLSRWQDVRFLFLLQISLLLLTVFFCFALTQMSKAPQLGKLVRILLNYIRVFQLLLIIIMFLFVVFSVIFTYKAFKNSGVGLYRFYQYERSKKKIKEALLDTMTINQEKKNSNKVTVPFLSITKKGQDVYITISKIAGMKEIENYVGIINSSLLRSFQDYAVTSMYEAKNGTYYEYLIEDVEENKSFKPRKIEDLVARKYTVILQKDVVIDLIKSPHILLSGLTGSGKTTVLFSIIGQLLGQGAVLKIIDPKQEFQQFKKFLNEESVSDNVASALRILEEAKTELDKRKELMKKQGYEEFGKTIKELDLSLYVVVIEELSALVSLLDKKEVQKWNDDLRYIITLGRAFGVNLIICGQSLPVDILPNKIRQNANTSILLGSATSEIARMVFPSVENVNMSSVDKFQGYYNVSGYTKHPKIYYVADLHSYNLNNFETMKKLYEIGEVKRKTVI